jgi:hypothetical protein
MAHLTVNLNKDNHRNIKEKSESKREFAPHAARSGVGFIESPWFPEKEIADLADPRRATSQPDTPVDITRNKDRVGGALAPITTRSGSTKLKKPLFVNTNNDIEFSTSRKRKTVGERLAEITELKQKVAMERRTLEKAILQSSGKASSSHSNTGHASRVSKSQEEDSSVESEVVDAESGLISEKKFKELTAAVKLYEKISGEEEAKKELKKLENKHETLNTLKGVNRDAEAAERSRDIERKRRGLTEEEARRRGPPDDNDLPNTYDYFAIKAQTQIRRWLAERFVDAYRISANQATKKIQTMIRGWEGRNRVKRLRRERHAATEIQRNWRGMNARVRISMK